MNGTAVQQIPYPVLLRELKHRQAKLKKLREMHASIKMAIRALIGPPISNTNYSKKAIKAKAVAEKGNKGNNGLWDRVKFVLRISPNTPLKPNQILAKLRHEHQLNGFSTTKKSVLINRISQTLSYHKDELKHSKLGWQLKGAGE